MAASQTDTDKGEARELVEQTKIVQRDFRERDKLYERIDEVIYQKKEPNVPRGFPNTRKVKTPLAPHIVNSVTAALTMNPYTVQYHPTQIGPSGEANATLREHVMNAAWKRQEREKKRRVFRAYGHSLVTYGEGIIKTMERTQSAWAPYDEFQGKLHDDLESGGDDGEYEEVAKSIKAGGPDAYKEHDRIYNARTEEFKRGLSYPIESIDVHPGTFYHITGEQGVAFAAEIKRIPYYPTLKRWKRDLNGDGKIVPEGLGLPAPEWSRTMGRHKELTMYEVWTWDKCAYILCGPGDNVKNGDGELVQMTRDHQYGIEDTQTLRGPYFHSLGITTSSREIAYMGQSVLFGFLDLFPWMDELATTLAAAARQYGFPRYKRNARATGEMSTSTFSRDGQDKIDREDATEEPGVIIPADLSPLDMPKSGPDLSKAIEICRDLIELCLPNIVQGVTSGDASGYLAAQATHLARLVWQPIVDNMEITLAERTAFEMYLIDQVIKEDVYVWGMAPTDMASVARKRGRYQWLGMGPSDIKGIYDCEVHLNPQTPSQDVLKVRAHDDMLRLHLESYEDAVTDMGNNPDEIELSDMLREAKAALLPDVIQQAVAIVRGRQQAKAAELNAKEQDNGTGGANNGRNGAVDAMQPGQAGQPIQPTAPGAGGTQNTSPAGGISGPAPGAPQVPSPAPASAVGA